METIDRLRGALSDRYRIEREIGRGGMAVVFLAHDEKHHRSVAIKVLRPELGAAVGVERFLREIEIAAQLNHPNILPLHDSGEADGLLYFVMPYVDGESLRDRLDRQGRLGLTEVTRIVREVGGALEGTPTGEASSTGTSSRRTSSSRPATPSSATSGSRGP